MSDTHKARDSALPADWPSPAWIALSLLLSFGMALVLAAFYGRALVEALLPAASQVIHLLDDRFAVVSLTIERDKQDTVVKLGANLVRFLAIGSRVVEPDPKGWLTVTSTLGATLQHLVIAVGLAGAWPASALRRLGAVLIAALLGMLFILVELPLTLHAYIWDMFVNFYEPDRLSPLLLWHGFMSSGGRLVLGVVLGGLAVALARLPGRAR